MTQFEKETTTMARNQPAQMPTRRDLIEAERDRQRDELRAILAPRLDDPIIDNDVCSQCMWCGAHDEYESLVHADDCPVLRRDEILGRETT